MPVSLPETVVLFWVPAGPVGLGVDGGLLWPQGSLGNTVGAGRTRASQAAAPTLPRGPETHGSCSVDQSCATLCHPMDCSTPVLSVPHQVPKFAQAHVHCISDAIQPSHPLMPSSPSSLNLSQHQGFSSELVLPWWLRW